MVVLRLGVRFLLRVARSSVSQPCRWERTFPNSPGRSTTGTEKAPPRKTWRLPFRGPCPAAPLRLDAGAIPVHAPAQHRGQRREPALETHNPRAHAHGPRVPAHTHTDLQTTCKQSPHRFTVHTCKYISIHSPHTEGRSIHSYVGKLRSSHRPYHLCGLFLQVLLSLDILLSLTPELLSGCSQR